MFDKRSLRKGGLLVLTSEVAGLIEGKAGSGVGKEMRGCAAPCIRAKQRAPAVCLARLPVMWRKWRKTLASRLKLHNRVHVNCSASALDIDFASNFNKVARTDSHPLPPFIVNFDLNGAGSILEKVLFLA